MLALIVVLHIPCSSIYQREHVQLYSYYWCLVTFGSYSLATLGWGVLTFKDKEAKYEELLKQIDEAKSFYKSKGLQLD